MLYFELSKNDHIIQKDKIKFSMHCLSLFTKDKISICHFCWAYNITYFVLKNYTQIQYNIIYVMVFFWSVLKFIFLELENSGSIESELQTSVLSIIYVVLPDLLILVDLVYANTTSY
jgi:hypothetical protein